MALRAQAFGGSRPRKPIEILRRLGAIQLDSVNALTRSHHLIPFSRLGSYEVASLYRAIYERRQGFEYWGHMASWLPIEDFRHFLPRMARMREQTRGWFATRAAREQHAPLYRHVLDRIRAEGPLGAAAFEDPSGRRGTWWDWKPAKRVLEDLFDMGELMAAGRTAGFARLYDLPERVLPPGLHLADPGPMEAARYLLRRGIEALGISSPSEAADYYRLPPAEWRPALADLIEEGEVVQLSVEGWRMPALAVPGALNGPLRAPRHPPTFLSPFDNLVWERGRTERLFGFRYRVEIYVPQPLRQYGYYVLPLLAHGRLGGRADLKHDRQAGALRVRRLWLEGASSEDAAHALARLAAQVGAERIEIERADHAEAVHATLRRSIEPAEASTSPI